MKILLQLLILSQHIKELNTVHLFLLLQSSEFYVFWRVSFVSDWAVDEIVVMSTHRAQSSSSANVLMELVLEIDERVV